MARDVRRWRLLAEEYRAMAEHALSERARHSLDGLAHTYDTLADRGDLSGAPPAPHEYVSRALECERFGEHADTPRARAVMQALATRWRMLAGGQG
jgi:hypothetical protein